MLGGARGFAAGGGTGTPGSDCAWAAAVVSQSAAHARLVETTRPEVIDEVQGTEPDKLLLEAVTDAAEDVHVMAARCPKRIGDVDKTRPGLFLFNHFVAEDPCGIVDRLIALPPHPTAARW